MRRPAICFGIGFTLWILGSVTTLAEPRCLCRYAAQYYDQGECVCMTTATGQRLACCGRVLNNSSWNFVADICVVARNATMEAQSLLTLHAGPHRVPSAGPVIQQARLLE